MIACAVCGKKFGRRDNMLRHKKTMHDDENGELVNTEKMNVSDNDSDSESPIENDSKEVDDDPSSSDERRNRKLMEYHYRPNVSKVATGIQ